MSILIQLFIRDKFRPESQKDNRNHDIRRVMFFECLFICSYVSYCLIGLTDFSVGVSLDAFLCL